MTNTKKNQFEELIDQMMIEEVSGIDQDIADTLKGLSTSKKRMAILSILDKDRDLFLKIKNTVKDNEVSKSQHIKNVVEMLRTYVKVGEVEKKTLGEVMTPIPLVNDMMNTLPTEVWSNPNLKWLDPCSGVGIFSCVIVERLMEGLVTFEPDEEKRYKHIVENMLYVGELQPKNMFLFLCAFDPNDEYALNIYTGSYLDEGFDNHMKDMWEVDKFDVIVMNPPYNKNSNGQQQAGILWDKFVVKAIDILLEGGYFVAVHPDSWRKQEGKTKNIQLLLRNKQMQYLEIHDRADGVKNFGVQTTYDFYCIKNVNNKNFKTKIKCFDGSIEFIDISNLDYIPNGMFSEIFNLIAKEGEEKTDMSLERYAYGTQKKYMSKIQTEEFKYPVFYLSYKDGSINTWYSSTDKKGHFGIPKVVWSNGTSTPIVDLTGEFGLTEFAYAIIDKPENLPLIKKAMESEKFIKLMSMTDGLFHRYNRKAIETFRKDFWKEFID